MSSHAVAFVPRRVRSAHCIVRMSSSSASIGEDGRPLPSVAHALLQAEAATHLCALTTDTLAEEAVKHAEQQRKGEEEEQRERELQEEPEVIDMPIELEVTHARSSNNDNERRHSETG